MTKKRGQPPKPPYEQRTRQMTIRHTQAERELIEQAYKLSESQRTLATWVASVTVSEAEKIIELHKKNKKRSGQTR